MPRSRRGDAPSRSREPSRGDPICASVPANSAATLLAVLHVGGLLFGGGFAIASDRGSRRAARDGGERDRAAQLAELARVHPLVMRGLWLSIGSGAALFALHAQAYLTSGIFWVKMALVVALLASGLVMQVAERDAREAGATGPAREASWRRLRGSAVASTTLWALTAAAGVVLREIR